MRERSGPVRQDKRRGLFYVTPACLKNINLRCFPFISPDIHACALKAKNYSNVASLKACSLPSQTRDTKIKETEDSIIQTEMYI